MLSVKVWEDRGSAVWEEPHLGFQHGRPWAPEPGGWILYLSLYFECYIFDSGFREFILFIDYIKLFYSVFRLH